MKLYHLAFVLIISTFLTACGGGSGGDSNDTSVDEVSNDTSADEVSNDGSTEVKQVGVLFDSPVSGVKYKTSSGLSGLTNSQGEYEFNAGDTVEFFIGDISLGSAAAAGLITTEDFPFPTQVAQFLQTLDEDRILDNGLQIPEEYHTNPLFLNSSEKPEEAGDFQKELDIQAFSESQQNQQFINEAVLSSNQEYREIVSSTDALEHARKAEHLKRIKENNSEFYDVITGEPFSERLPDNTLLNEELSFRIAYYLYKKAYQGQLSKQADLLLDGMGDVEITQDKIESFAKSYLNVGGLITELTVYTSDFVVPNDLSGDAKRRLTSALASSGRSEASKVASIMVEKLAEVHLEEGTSKTLGEVAGDSITIIENCGVYNIPWPSVTNTANEAIRQAVDKFVKGSAKYAETLVNCAMGETVKATGRFVNTFKGLPLEQEYQHHEIARNYLDQFFICGPFNTECMADKFDGAQTRDTQLQYIMEQYFLDAGIDWSVRQGAHKIIDEYLEKVFGFTQTIVESLPDETLLLNRYAEIESSLLKLNVEPLKLSEEDEGVLWVNLDIDNLSDRDIFITSFEPTLILNSQETTFYNDYYQQISKQLYENTFLKYKSVNDIRIPISLNNLIPDQDGIAKLVIDLGFETTDRSTKKAVRVISGIDLGEIWKSVKLEQLDAGLISLEQDISTADSSSSFTLPTVYLAGKAIENPEDIIWKAHINSPYQESFLTSLESNDHKLTVPKLADGFNSDFMVLNAFIKTSPYSKPATLILNIAKRIDPESLLIQLPDGSVAEKWVDLPSYGTVFTNYLGVDAIANKIDFTGDYQCPDVVNRFYSDVFAIPEEGRGNGKDVAMNFGGLKGTYQSSPIIIDYHSDGLSKQPPMNGSIVSFDRDNTIGHVAIIKKVETISEDEIKGYLIEQNWIWASGNKIAHSRPVSFKKDTNGYWHGTDLESNPNKVIGWTTARLDGLNQAPIANAGDDKYRPVGKGVTFDALNSSDDQEIISYEWSESGTVLSNEVSFVKLDFEIGIHEIMLKVTDSFGEQATDNVVITIYDKESDFDADLLPDYWEIEYELDLQNDDSKADNDGDGRNNLQEFQDGTDPNKTDEPVDTTPPVISLIGDSVVEIEQGSPYTDKGATASDNKDDDLTAEMLIVGDQVDTNTVGTYIITYDVTDEAGNSAEQVTRTVNVVQATDTEAPIITLLGSATVEVEQGTPYTDKGATASDNKDGDLTAEMLIVGDQVDTNTVGVYIITYDVADKAGNSAEQVTRTVNVVQATDTEAPIITLLGSATVEVEQGSPYTDKGATASDNKDGDLTAEMLIVGDQVDTNTVGIYIITYDVADKAGNSAEQVTRTVNVVEASTPVATGKLNDTGITWGGNYPSGNNAAGCAGETIDQQDCSMGRDAQALAGTLTKVGGGTAGFDFTKLGADGSVLAIQNGTYEEGGSETAGTKWSCVKDNHTGLIWEVKTNTPQGTDLHSRYDRYNWYNTDLTTNGSSAGYADDDGDICTGYNSADSTTFCNTEAFVNRVNIAGLCGANDWRLPNLNELQSIANHGKSNPAIDESYFPNSQSSFNWSSSPNANNRYHSWGVSFSNGNDNNDILRDNYYHVRLVRSGQ